MPSEPAVPVAYLATTRLMEKGQITVPKAYRAALALEEGAQVSLLQLGRGLVLIPEQKRFRQLCERVARTFASHGVTTRDLLRTLPETRERVVARHYATAKAPKPLRKRSPRK
jgi:AbrB family looped-hinge helix DNA binding protein